MRLSTAPTRRIVLGLADAGMSSIGNLGVSVLVARSTSIGDFGVFATAMIVLLLSTVAARSVHGDPLILLSRPDDARAMADEAASSSWSVLRWGATTGAAVVAVAIAGGLLQLWTRDVGVLLVVCGLALPVLWLQDHYRWVEYARAASHLALINNTIWTVGAIGSVAVASSFSGGSLTAAVALALWVFSAVPSIGFASRRAGAPRRPPAGSASGWIRPRATLIRQLTLDFSLTQATAQGATLLIALLVGTLEISFIRKGQIWMGPLTVMITGLMSALQPVMAARARQTGRQSVVRLAYVVGLGAAALCVLYGAIVLLLPTEAAETLVGPGWTQTRPYLPPLIVLAAASVLGGCLGIALRTTGSLRRQVRWRGSLAPASVLSVAVATAWGGGLVGMWVIAGAGALTTAAWGVLLRLASTDEHDVEPRVS